MLPMAFMGTTELIIVALVIILLFGARKLPEIAKGLGESINAFRKAINHGIHKDPDEKPDTSSDQK